MQWLVTGGAGFIGSSFIRLALAAHPELRIVNLDALTYSGRRETLADLEGRPGYAFLHGDICDGEAVEAALKLAGDPPQAIVHFAAESHVDRSIADASAFIRTNVQGTQMLLDAARRHGVARFLHVSTDEVYGSLGREGRFTEQTPLAPNSPYAASKAASDLLVRAAVHTHGLPAIITRASNNFGPYQFPEKLIPLAISNASADRPIPMYGKGENVRNWIYVDDHCRGILAALERGQPGGVYNLGGDAELDNKTLLESILGLLGKPASLIQSVADRPGHDFRYSLDSTLARRELGWAPQVELAAGLRRTVAWYGEHAAWLASVRDGHFENYYQRQYAAAPPAEAGSK
ncbi:MAG TPA: dTDP-glucose 4,6-dehydratase [Terriglobales bacterium]|nr:dTDP-glucose 4,6-dehydratase [Terriglobales bacterium]